MSRALVLIDLQYDFCPGGALAVAHGDETIAIARRLIPAFEIVVATQDWHPRDHGSFAVNHPGAVIGTVGELAGLPQVWWPAHCVQDTRGAELCIDPSLLTAVFRKGTDPAIDSYSGFFDGVPQPPASAGVLHFRHRRATGLGDWLRAHGVTDLVVLGLATDYCVKFTALDARADGFAVTVVEDGCRAVDLAPGDGARAFAAMRDAGCDVRASTLI